MRTILLGLLGLGTSACVTSDSVLCTNADGTALVCPAGTTCTLQPTIGATICASPAAVAACVGLAEGDPCDLANLAAPLACHDGVCQPVSCGDGFTDPSEVCDDHNTISGDGCSADCMSTEVCGNMQIDPIHDEQCDDGPDHLGHDGCSPACTYLEVEEWAQLQIGLLGQSPEAMAYDPNRRQTISFGLVDTTTVSWDGIRWDQERTLVTPGKRSGYAIAYDDTIGKVVLFSGGDAAADTWTWNGGDWRAVATTQQPSPRGSSMVYDSTRGRIVLFGGFLASTISTIATYQDTWEFDGDWHRITTAQSPPARYGHGMAYDPHRHVTVLFGGSDMTFYNDVLGDVWEYDGTTWTQSLAGGRPSARAVPAMAFDPVNNKVMVIGGRTDLVTAVYDASEWDGTTWSPIAPVPIVTAGAFVAAATDPVRGRVVVEASDGNVYEWTGTSWVAPPRGGTALPVARMSAVAVNDLHRRELVMFGGSTNNEGTNTGLAETWVFDGAWHPTVGGGPSARYASAMAYDSTRDETLLFGGCDSVSDALADTWLWKNHAWMTASAGPSKRCHAGAAYDVASDRVVLFGGTTAGQDNGSLTLGDTWTWNGTTWHPETPAMSPLARYGMAMAYDPIRHQTVMFGGQAYLTTPSPHFEYYSDTWVWDGTTWTQIQNTIAPVARSRASLAWDAGRGRLVLFGGQRGGLGAESLDDAFEWSGTGWEPLPVAPGFSTSGRYGHASASSPFGAGVVMYGGQTRPVGVGATPSAPFADTWRLRWESGASYETCGGVDGDGDGLVGCADPDCWWLCTPLCPPGTSCTTAASCGDGTCDPRAEQCDSCPADCGICP